MIQLNKELSYPISEILFVFALDSEAGNLFNHTQKLITGIGKVNAAIALTKAIQEKNQN